MALHSIFDFSAEKIKVIAWSYERLSASIFGESMPVAVGLLIIFGFLCGGAVVLYKKREYARLTGLGIVVLISQLYQLIVSFTMPAGWEERYLWGTFTFMTICMLWGGFLTVQAVLGALGSGKLQRMGGVTVWLALVIAMVSVQWKVIDGGNGVAYLFNPYKDVELLEEHGGLPWVVYDPVNTVYSYYDWLIPEQICFLSQDKTVEDVAALRQLTGVESFVLYCTPDNSLDAISFFEQAMETDLACDELTKSVNLTVYLVSVVKE